MDLLKICRAFVFSVMMVYTMTGCGKKKGDEVYQSPPGYDFAHPYIVKLPFELDEVSGIVYYPKDTSLFMQVDEKGNIYKMSLSRPDIIQKWKIADAGDYEDIVLLDSTFYLLRSEGNIVAVKILSENLVDSREYAFPEQSDNEFEILYYDSVIRQMVLICKDCEDQEKKVTQGYAFDPATRTFVPNAMSIDAKKISKLVGEKIGKFKPSAASINPITGSLYIISATDKLLVIADRNGSPKAAFKLDPGMFKQPEGLTFTSSGTLIISNEAAEVGMANILVFKANNTSKATGQNNHQDSFGGKN